MVASENITTHILDNARAVAGQITDEAQKKAQSILEIARPEAEMLSAQAEKSAQKAAERIEESASSSGNLAVRNALLRRRREEIDKTLEAVILFLDNLKQDDYFEFLLKLVRKNHLEDKGKMLLSQRDFERVPETFKNALKEWKIEVSDESDKTISDGFVLKYGDIEINARFSALIDEKRETLEDLINKELFQV